MIERRQGWETRLAYEFMASRNLPFSWYLNDCCSFAARCVKAITSIDLFECFEGSYRNQKSALRVLKEHGRVMGICDSFFGQRVNSLSARRGDLILLRENGLDAIAICAGRVAFIPGREGLMPRNQDRWIAAWRVG